MEAYVFQLVSQYIMSHFYMKIIVVTATNTLQKFSCTWILEPTKDLVIDHSIVTSWLVDALLNLSALSWIITIEVTFSHMLNLQKVRECISLRKFVQA